MPAALRHFHVRLKRVPMAAALVSAIVARVCRHAKSRRVQRLALVRRWLLADPLAAEDEVTSDLMASASTARKVSMNILAAGASVRSRR
jgi:hypothetical protein